jgi:two-component system sensor histidine kinase and response regulator WspE
MGACSIRLRLPFRSRPRRAVDGGTPARTAAAWLEEPAPVVEPLPEAPKKTRRTTENGERVLRVTAERLNSLLDLSSKSLVETQRLKPHLATMQRLKRMQNNGLRALENLNVHLKEHALSLEAQEALEDARRLLAKPLLVEKRRAG